MYYDLHIHSGLSPCSDDDMSPNNIINMAKIKGLDIISITDHNSTLNLKTFLKVANKLSIKLIFGIEVQTKEEVHVLAYFDSLDNCNKFQTYIDKWSNHIINDSKYFGNQYLYDELDNVVGEYKELLLGSVNASIEEVCASIHLCGGIVCLAHVLDRVNSITHQLGFIPSTLDYDCLEVKSIDEINKIQAMYNMQLTNIWLINSDAHRLVDINEREYSLDFEELERLWGKYRCKI